MREPDRYDAIAGTLAAWPGARRSGAGYRLPCPVHEGRGANLHVWPREDGSIGATCHSHQCRYADILAALGLARRQAGPRGREEGRRPPARAARRAGRANSGSREHGRSLWMRSTPAAGTPAAVYLTARGTWPPDVALPESVRWLPRQALGAADRGWHKDLTGAADFAGLVLYTYRPPGASERAAPVSVEVEGLTADGQRLPRRYRRNFGGYTGACFTAREQPTGPVALAEGPCSALALVWLLPPDTTCRAAGGAANLTPALVADVAPERPVQVYADADGSGRSAAWGLAAALVRAGYGAVAVAAPAPNGLPPDTATGHDPADALAALVAAGGWRWIVEQVNGKGRAGA